MKNKFNLIVLILFMGLFITACTTQRNAEKYMDAHPDVSAAYCAKEYPVKDSIGKPNIVYVKADNKDLSRALDSVKNENDDVRKEFEELKEISKIDTSTVYRDKISKLNDKMESYSKKIQKLRDEYKPCKSDTLLITEKHYLTNTAEVHDVKNKLRDANIDLVAARKWKSIFMYWAFAATGLLGGGLLLKKFL